MNKESVQRLTRIIIVGYIAYTMLFLDHNHIQQFSIQEHNMLSILGIGLIVILIIDMTNEFNK